MPRIEITTLDGFPLIVSGDDLSDLIVTALAENSITLQPGDTLVLAQKIISKAEGRLVALATISPSAEAEKLAGTCNKDPRLVELILSESDQVMRAVPGVLIVRHRLGYVMANAGIDQSNIEGDDTHALLLPRDPDRSASDLRRAIGEATGTDIAIVIADSFGRAWRMGTCGVAIGTSGLAPVHSMTGSQDMFGRTLQHTEIAVADEIAAAASLAMGQGAEGTPVVHIRGAADFAGSGTAQDLIRPVDQDLFQ